MVLDEVNDHVCGRRLPRTRACFSLVLFLGTKQRVICYDSLRNVVVTRTSFVDLFGPGLRNIRKFLKPGSRSAS
jgi:hypothetical protein